jgi:HD-GYP domain-containing protein (c-di-GMP phosphodiesterase class II)
MTTDRPYRRGLSTEVAVAELERGKGSAFDVDVVNAFLGTLKLAS